MNEITITPLGTVSPYPKGIHNCPSFLIQYQNENILLDCGNGCTRLLHFPEDLQNLHVFISHFHQDHYGDIGAIQYASYVYHKLGELNHKVHIYLPNYDSLSRKSILAVQESYAQYHDIKSYTNYFLEDLKISFLDNHSHSIPSYMIKLENESFKVVYTSDIGYPNQMQVVNFADHADLLICESSLLNSYPNSNVHLTASEAGMIANVAHVKKLLLTHFWPEEDRNKYLEEAKYHFLSAEVAEEGQKLVLRRNLSWKN